MVVLCNVFWLFDTKSRFFSVIFCATPTAVRLSFIKCVSTSSEASFGVLVVRTKQNVCLCWRGAASAASFFLHPLLLSSHADKFTDRLSCVFSLSLLSQSPFFTRFFRLWKMRVCAKKLREIWCSRGLWYSASAASEAAATTGVVEASVLRSRGSKDFSYTIKLIQFVELLDIGREERWLLKNGLQKRPFARIIISWRERSIVWTFLHYYHIP